MGGIDYKQMINLDNLPKHIAIIMDGNGRWAKERKKSRSYGHQAGSKALERVLRAADALGIPHLTVYAFSTENWQRPKEEVDSLMNLLRSYLKKYLKDSEKNNIKIDIIGDKAKLDEDIQEQIRDLEMKTSKKSGLNLHIALNYGSRDEIIRAVKKMSQDVLESKLNLDSIDQHTFSMYLDTKAIPDPDLLIRTSGEQRLSNFLLWQIAYSELYFCDKLWPDYDENDLYKAIYEFQNRNRRFGLI
ncbi:MAG: undecaprenyl diphosphate synthase [Epulopiscium sp.]|jgi:undecaprenyl diphosphate synthase|uniref:isoprenyl transferase n=1 Tax=Defluviitalea raffinosedens TaxID=1450156 RepID=UPI001D2DA07A|nr:isoprenyl transferase [Defluviitalea raffinosedens]MBM7685170.1 undecaprenyl diphosphate synthase [Defluviitalea raffinosedens]MBZ4669633.1 uppS [Defluviitaleaceae bacterium]MDK2787184.1 undecaprenyl diphosphate synthase [Candidatus Epulonipiscium sp.]